MCPGLQTGLGNDVLALFGTKRDVDSARAIARRASVSSWS